MFLNRLRKYDEESGRWKGTYKRTYDFNRSIAVDAIIFEKFSHLMRFETKRQVKIPHFDGNIIGINLYKHQTDK